MYFLLKSDLCLFSFVKITISSDRVMTKTRIRYVYYSTLLLILHTTALRTYLVIAVLR